MCYCHLVLCVCVFVCLVTRERFGLAHAPLFLQRHLCKSCLCVCVSCDEGVFEAWPCTSPFTKTFKLLCLLCRSCLCVSVPCYEGAFGLAHAPLLSQRHSNFSVLCANLACVFVCLVTSKCSGFAHVPLPFTNTIEYMCLVCVSLPLVCSLVL